MKIYVVSILHRQYVINFVRASYESCMDALYDYCRRRWADDTLNEMSRDQAIKMYFEERTDEHYSLDIAGHDVRLPGEVTKELKTVITKESAETILAGYKCLKEATGPIAESIAIEYGECLEGEDAYDFETLMVSCFKRPRSVVLDTRAVSTVLSSLLALVTLEEDFTELRRVYPSMLTSLGDIAALMQQFSQVGHYKDVEVILRSLNALDAKQLEERVFGGDSPRISSVLQASHSFLSTVNSLSAEERRKFLHLIAHLSLE